MRLDARDLDILRALARDGRMTNADLAAAVGLSASPCWERVRKLQEAGVIEGIHARIALRKIGPHVSVFVTVELTDHTAAAFRAFEAAMARYDQVTGCWALGGGYDYLLHIVARDIEGYQALLDDMLEAGIGLARYFTYVVTKTVKNSAVPPFAALLDI
ncbi:AsnC family transcriptional regulator [Pelagivirga sediminicola]|uniref:AsnC family transcriptional regulator n=1 Tax=Pelagivirga sediminicola TaxID=2170575 RepID=A0A2T7G900_9RHOB|nr:Lrp/AsnC family transcriptional regulator [Pelagivirga sediminicola]PVA10881.1 AsnC family transcriptional regulator [Pelagivirga sediminicola]